MGENEIESIRDNQSVRVSLSRLDGTRIDTDTNHNNVSFDVDVKMDELNRTNNDLTLGYLLTITTKPSLVQYEAGGIAVVSGGRKAFEEALSIDENSDVPRLLHTIYQKVFTSLYIISSLIDMPYPPPDLIHNPYQVRELGSDGQEVLEAAQQVE